MRRTTRRAWWVAALASGLAAGCQFWGGRPAYSDDPLVLSKKPIEGQPAQTAAPMLLARAEPLMPPFPASALVAVPPPSQDAPTAEIPAPTTAAREPAEGPTLMPRPPLQPNPAVRIKSPVRLEALPTGREKVLPAPVSQPAAPVPGPF